ncbi:MAG: cysteine dioxygenase family protein [Proteobacteria bacterium]|nr:cysteine dioxygenase family protein [Pseudomonadota bacterium]
MLRLAQEITTILERGPVGLTEVKQMEQLVALAVPRLQQTVLCSRPLQPGRYLCYQDKVHGFVIMVLAWGPGDATLIHDHGIWGVEAVLKHSLRVTNFDESETDPQPLSSMVISAGDVMHNLPPARDVHRVEHASGDCALSLHIYGKEMTNNRSFVPGVGFRVCQLACHDLCLADVCQPCGVGTV